eukprot:885211-Pyramimonas_sp.AAC.2
MLACFNETHSRQEACLNGTPSRQEGSDKGASVVASSLSSGSRDGEDDAPLLVDSLGGGG